MVRACRVAPTCGTRGAVPTVAGPDGGGRMTNEDQQAKVAGLIKDARIAMLTTVGADGSLVSRPMGVQDVDFDGDLWFFADADSHKVAEIEHGSPANAAFADSSSWVSVSGPAEVVRDVAKQRELWGPA